MSGKVRTFLDFIAAAFLRKVGQRRPCRRWP